MTAAKLMSKGKKASQLQVWDQEHMLLTGIPLLISNLSAFLCSPIIL